jgi:NADH-quinone oxidoreductase subunit L
MYREAFIMRLLYLLNMFATSVIFLFFVFDFFTILIVWELIGLFSLLLVNFYSIRVYTLKAAMKTFIFSRLSDFFLFTVFVFLIFIFNTTDLSVLFIQVPFFIFYNVYFCSYGFNLINLLSIFLLIASAVKAAQFFFHVWLPDAMEAPTPASALIHSSTLVIMGIYLIIRFNILFEFSPLANTVLALFGSLTIAFGAVTATFQNDIKKLVAYSTISQMGYLFCGCGFMCYTEVLLYLAVHALNKAFLFILVGYIVHFFIGNTNLRFMGSLYTYTTDLYIVMIFISLNLTGLPVTSGFLAKEFLLFQTFRDGFFIYLVRSFWFISFVFTPVYMVLLNLNVMFGFKKTKYTLYRSSKITQYFTLLRNNSKFINFSYSLIISRLGILVYFILFLINNLVGEFLVLVLFEISSPQTLLFSKPLTLIGINPLWTVSFYNDTLTSLINY